MAGRGSGLRIGDRDVRQGRALEFEEDEVSLFDLDSVPGQRVESSGSRSAWMLAATVLSSRKFNVDAMISTLIRVWRPFKGAQGRAIGDNLFVFTFFHERDMVRVLEGGPWHFDNQLVVLKSIVSLGEAATAELGLCAFWVRVQGLSPYSISTAQAQGIGRKIGEFLEYDGDVSKSLSTDYIRIRVSIDVTKPIKRGMLIVKKGVPQWFDFRYERLPNYCFWCGGFDHVERDCVVAFEDDAKEGDIRKFAGLRTMTTRPVFTKVANSARWIGGEGSCGVGPRFVHRSSGEWIKNLSRDSGSSGKISVLEDGLTGLQIRDTCGQKEKADVVSEMGDGVSVTRLRDKKLLAGKDGVTERVEVPLEDAVADDSVHVEGGRGAGASGIQEVRGVGGLNEQLGVEQLGVVSGQLEHNHNHDEERVLGANNSARVMLQVHTELQSQHELETADFGPSTATLARKNHTLESLGGTWRRRLRPTEDSVLEVAKMVVGSKRPMDRNMEVLGGEQKLRRVDAVILASTTASSDEQGRRTP